MLSAILSLDIIGAAPELQKNCKRGAQNVLGCHVGVSTGTTSVLFDSVCGQRPSRRSQTRAAAFRSVCWRINRAALAAVLIAIGMPPP